MTYTAKSFNRRIVALLRRGGVGVIPTDTVYAIVGSALRPVAVRRIYKLRKRNLKKPMIVLIASIGDLKQFGVRLNPVTRKVLQKVWPGKISVILPLAANHSSLIAKIAKFRYLHRGTKTIAFRLPKPAALRKLLQRTGPLVAPSANWEGKPPAKTIRKAKKYFGNKVDFYADGGKLKSLPSTLVVIHGRNVRVLRKGAGRIFGGLSEEVK